jgi:hypothetical protein
LSHLVECYFVGDFLVLADEVGVDLGQTLLRRFG